jgi:hypothetical protein
MNCYHYLIKGQFTRPISRYIYAVRFRPLKETSQFDLSLKGQGGLIECKNAMQKRTLKLDMYTNLNNKWLSVF